MSLADCNGRTADLPVFRTRDNSSPNTARVRDLHFSHWFERR
jgi:hypothetical protein